MMQALVTARLGPTTRPISGPFKRTIAGPLAALVLALAACSGVPKPTQVTATLQAGAGVNPDLRKRASPLVVRLYELKSTAAFDSADFVSLYERDQATLSAEMGAREEFVLRPGESRNWDKMTAPDTKYIGVIAAFRDIERARWKTIVELKPGTRNTLAIRVDSIAVEAKRTAP